ADAEHGDVLHLVISYAGSFSISDGGMRTALQAGRQRQRHLDDASSFLVERSRFVTFITQTHERVPHGWVNVFEFLYVGRKFCAHLFVSSSWFDPAKQVTSISRTGLMGIMGPMGHMGRSYGSHLSHRSHCPMRSLGNFSLRVASN